MTKKELVQLLIDNFCDDNGNLNLTRLDFSEFDGDVDISYMRVKNNIFQSNYHVGANVFQNGHTVRGSVHQRYHKARRFINDGAYVSGKQEKVANLNER